MTTKHIMITYIIGLMTEAALAALAFCELLRLIGRLAECMDKALGWVFNTYIFALPTAWLVPMAIGACVIGYEMRQVPRAWREARAE